MEPIESDIEKAAGAIIGELGINALTVDALALQMGIPKNELPAYLKNEVFIQSETSQTHFSILLRRLYFTCSDYSTNRSVLCT